MVLGMIPMGFAADQTAGEILKGYNLLAGDENGNLNEDQYLNRAEMMVILARMNGKFEDAKSFALPSSYNDLAGFGWAVPYIAYAEMNEWTSGVGEGKFDPAGPVTLQMAAYFMVEALGYADPADFSWTTAVEKATSLGLLAGVQANGLDNVLRGDLFKVMLQTLNTNVKDGSATLGVKLGVMKPAVPAVVSAAATNQETVKVTFNKDIKSAVVKDFDVFEKANADDIQVVEKVKVSGNAVYVTLVDALEEDVVYSIKVAGVVAADNTVMAETATYDFTYKATAPVSIAFKSTTVADTKKVEYIIKDAAGNDITPNYTDEDLDIQTSNSGVIDYDLTANYTDGGRNYSVVNLVLEVYNVDGEVEKEIETGNTVIFVKSTLDTLKSLGDFSIEAPLADPDFDDPTTSIFEDETAELKMHVEVINQDGDVMADDEVDKLVFSYRSLNPGVLVVNQNGILTPVKVGTASIVVTVEDEDADIKVSKTYSVTVKAEAEATSITVDKSSVKLVIGSEIEQKVKVKVLDQYGDVMKNLNGNLEVRVSKTPMEFFINGLQTFGTTWTDPELVAFEDGETTLVFAADNDTQTASVSIRYEYEDDKYLPIRSVSVSVVKAGTFAGYVAEADDLKLDINGDDEDADYPTTSAVTVYAKDVNGNFIEVIGDDDEEVVTLSSSDSKIVKVNSYNEVSVNAVDKKTGTAKVTVKVDNVTIGTLTFTVINSAPTLSKVDQLKTTARVDNGDDVIAALFGTANDDGMLVDGDVFVAYDQNGKEIGFDLGEIDIISSKTNIIDNFYGTDGDVSRNATDVDGTVTLTVIIDGDVYIVTVVVS
jgi:hypothetical protein